MAFSSTVAFKNVAGNTRIVCLSMVADSANGDTTTSGTGGIGYCFAAQISPISMTTSGPFIKINKNSAGSTSNGNVSISACATGDVFYLTIWGRS